MKITREKHMAHLARLMPLLIFALGLQCWVYMQWAPFEMALDVTIFEAVGLVLIAAGFAVYDNFHTVKLHRNHLVIRFALMGIEEEILYRDIQFMDIEASRHAYYNVNLILRDGTECKLWYLDDVQDLKSFIKSAS